MLQCGCNFDLDHLQEYETYNYLFTITRDGKDLFNVNIDKRKTILDIKKVIEAEHKIAVDEQTLTFEATTLEDDHLISDYGLTSCMKLKLSLPLPCNPKEEKENPCDYTWNIVG